MKTISLAAILPAIITLMIVNATGAQTPGGTSAATSAPQSDDEVMMTGTVVSTSADGVIIRTAEGNLTCKFKSGVDRPANLAPGAQVTFWVDEDDADDNPPGEKVESETYTILRMTVTPAAAPTPPPAAKTTPPPQPASSSPVRTEPTPEPTPVAEDELPDTASPLVAIGVMGVLALAGSFGIRRLRRHSNSM